MASARSGVRPPASALQSDVARTEPGSNLGVELPVHFCVVCRHLTCSARTMAMDKRLVYVMKSSSGGRGNAESTSRDPGPARATQSCMTCPRPAHHAAGRSSCSCLSHSAIWFQLALFWTTNLRSPAITRRLSPIASRSDAAGTAGSRHSESYVGKPCPAYRRIERRRPFDRGWTKTTVSVCRKPSSVRIPALIR